LKKLVDLPINHKFRGGLLGIIITVTTASEEVTTARRLCFQWKHITTARTNITTAYFITVRETRVDNYRIDLVYILFY
jgi:hypothetical protein